MLTPNPLRMSWPDTMTRLMAKRRILKQDTSDGTKKVVYVDASVQTEEDNCAHRTRAIRTHSLPVILSPPVVYVYETARHPVCIGTMQELCRKEQYRLGDALHHV